jgi:carbamoyl-phosphate synthase small subunit
MRSILVLEDGSTFEGVSAGAAGERIGEVILNTSVVGYQEMMTDPSNAGKILVFTYPLIGNYGTARKFYESNKCRVEAVIMKEKSNIHSNWQAEEPFGDFLKREDVFALSDADTRTIAVKIREDGQMLGIVSNKDLDKEGLVKKLKAYKKGHKADFIKDISVKKFTQINTVSSGPKIGILDLGMLKSFNEQLKTLGCDLTLIPHDTPAKKILDAGFDGLIISNGPEEDAAVPDIELAVKGLLGKIPILGICLGHEIIALALGGKLKKMKVGHHGVNYPVKPPDSYKGHITVQNHSIIVDEDSICSVKGVKITLRNLNDNSIEEMEGKTLKFISTQYYPASPGFDEVHNVFKRFLDMINSKERKLEYAKA